MTFEWVPSSKPDKERWISKIQPIDVLFEFDGPLIFTGAAPSGLLLFYKCDQAQDSSLYLITPTNYAIIEDLKNGKLSLRNALRQACAWIAKVNINWEVSEVWTVNGLTLPDAILPERGYGLNVQHGIIPEPSAVSQKSYLEFHFEDGRNNVGHLSLGVLARYLESAYECVWKIVAEDALASDTNLTEHMLRRSLLIPAREPSLASLHLIVDKPRLDLIDYIATQSTNKAVKPQAVEKAMDDACRQFVASASDVLNAVTENKFSVDVAADNADAIRAFEALIPTKRSYFGSFSISGHFDGAEKAIQFDREKGRIVRDAYKDFINKKRSLKGKVVEVNTTSQTFIIETHGARQVTCKPFGKEARKFVSDEIDYLVGKKVAVSGPYEERPRRDMIWCGSILILED